MPTMTREVHFDHERRAKRRRAVPPSAANRKPVAGQGSEPFQGGSLYPRGASLRAAVGLAIATRAIAQGSSCDGVVQGEQGIHAPSAVIVVCP